MTKIYSLCLDAFPEITALKEPLLRNRFSRSTLI